MNDAAWSHTKRANRAAGAKSQAEWAAEEAANTLPNRRVPVSLQAENFPSKVGLTDEDSTDPALRRARDAFSSMSESLADMHRRERAILSDTTATDAAKNLRVADLVNRATQKPAEKMTEAHQTCRSEIEAIDREIERGFQGRQPEAKAQEIRAHLKSLSAKERRKILNEGDPDVLSAVLSAKPFLSGLTEADVAKAKHDATQQLFPEQIARRAKLEKALNLIDERSARWLSEAHGLYDNRRAKQDAERANQARKALEF